MCVILIAPSGSLATTRLIFNWEDWEGGKLFFFACKTKQLLKRASPQIFGGTHRHTIHLLHSADGPRVFVPTYTCIHEQLGSRALVRGRQLDTCKSSEHVLTDWVAR